MFNKKLFMLLLCLVALCPFCLRAGAHPLYGQTAPQGSGQAPVHGQTRPSDRDELRIRRIMNDQVQAWNGGDITAFMQGYWNNDSLTFITKNGPEYGWQMVLDHYKKGYPDRSAMGFLQFDHLILKRLSPEYYLVIGSWHLQKDAGDMGGQFTLLFRKIHGEWKIVLDHTS
jgi:ketosteroid isomerase-like protein